MSSKTKDIKENLSKLLKEAFDMITEFHAEMKASKTSKKMKASDEAKTPIIMRYNKWYSTAMLAIKQVLPDRLIEFTELYKLPKRDNKNITYLNYTISDYLLGLRISRLGEDTVDTESAFLSKFQQQYSILYSAISNTDSILKNIKGVLQADLFDSEIETSRELFKNGHLRAAGAICGVSLEKHLSTVLTQHNLGPSKKHPTIADYIEVLKSNNVVDLAEWRYLQRLADIRNLCAHHKEREPKAEEVQELIDGTDKILKTLA